VSSFVVENAIRTAYFLIAIHFYFDIEKRMFGYKKISTQLMLAVKGIVQFAKRCGPTYFAEKKMWPDVFCGKKRKILSYCG